jgi:hypothetical protein
MEGMGTFYKNNLLNYMVGESIKVLKELNIKTFLI